MPNISKNFRNQPPSAPISTSMNIGPGGQSPAMYEPPANAPLSPMAYEPPRNPPVSKNFTEAGKAARAASKVQNSATHKVLRGKW